VTTDLDSPGQNPRQLALQARARNDWAAAYDILRAADGASALGAGDLELLAECARFSGHPQAIAEPLERAHRQHAARGDHEGAARTALALCVAHGDQCRYALAASWRSRAEEFVAQVPEGPIHALWQWFEARRHGEQGDREAQERAAVQCLELARAHGDRGVEALALIELGHTATARGDTRTALDALDRATSFALGGEIGPFESGLVICNAIFASRSRGEWDRACEWTEFSTRWVQRTNVAYFPGLCRVHRSEVLRVRGELQAAAHESEQAALRLRSTLPRWESYAQAELGEVRRRLGDLAGALQAFRRALELGWEAQPGMALLLLAQGDPAAAFRSLGRFCASPAPTLLCADRAALLSARVTVALAAGEVAAAAAAAADLAAVAGRDDALPWDRAAAARARGELALQRGDAADAVAALTEARLLWAELEAPYELAICRFVLARALAAAGDRHGARIEGEIAARAFAGIGAAGDERQVQQWLAGAAATAATAGERSRAVAADLAAALRREGDTWQVTFAGRSVRLQDSVGVQYLARLLAAPEQNCWAVELAGSSSAGDGTRPVDVGGGGDLIDAEARAAYRDRLRELQEELAEARECADEAAAERITAEMDQLTRHLASALGLQGRPRRLGGAVERARQSVTKALRSVLRRVAAEHGELGHYLRATIRTGTACRFEPDPRHPVRWVVTL
jgi:tetratricopeptide (TPR) repeat protein